MVLYFQEGDKLSMDTLREFGTALRYSLIPPRPDGYYEVCASIAQADHLFAEIVNNLGGAIVPNNWQENVKVIQGIKHFFGLGYFVEAFKIINFVIMVPIKPAQD